MQRTQTAFFVEKKIDRWYNYAKINLTGGTCMVHKLPIGIQELL